ncbi:MAG: aminotransferase class I/II-fold pyridoxal phosphate-dependent enzyme [Planctomycetota bacterium]
MVTAASDAHDSGLGTGPEPIEILRGARGYAVPHVRQPIDLHLHANERVVLPASVSDALASVPADAARTYPDAGRLESLFADRFGISPDRVLATAGGDESLDRVCRAFLEPGREMVLAVPSFEMIERYGRLARGEIVRVAWDAPRFPIDAVLAAVTDRTAVIPIVSPNNPTGWAATAEEVTRVARAAPRALIVLDCAYAEYMEEDPTPAGLAEPNVVVIRTLSKAWGLAGLRVGCAAGPAGVIAAMRAAGGPYSVAQPSIQVAHARLGGDTSDVAAHAARVRTERDELIDLLGRLDFTVSAQQANFVFARSSRSGWVREALAGLGIGIRGWPGRAGLDDAVRITLPGDEQMYERLVAGVRAALEPEALLFDMDGVLADESVSYHAAVIQTAAGLGVTVTRDDIVAAKAAGNSNDDWALTYRFVTQAGVDIAFEALVERFESIYQMLREQEPMIFPRESLERLASRVPLAIVTGRPRGDAARFLEAHDAGRYFTTVVTMNCTETHKPDSAPVREALTRLGVTRAWMIGDMPDDQTAARGAGVVPLGTIAPGMSASVMGPALESAGAARVFERSADFAGFAEEVLG